jgi:hypothetical protein
VNHGTPQQQDGHPVAPNAWPTFLEPSSNLQLHAPVASHATAQMQQPAAPAAQPAWGMAAPPHAPQMAPIPQHYAPMQQQHASQATLMPPHVEGGGFAYPTAQGMQIVQQPQHGGMVATAHMPMANPGAIAAAPASADAAARKRMRWEVIVPTGTAIVLLVTAIVVFTNFDRITGSGAGASAGGHASRNPAAADDGMNMEDMAAMAKTIDPDKIPDILKSNTQEAPDPTLSPAEGRAAVAKSKQLVKLGRYDEALATIAPLAKGDTIPPVVSRLRTQIAANSKSNDELLARLGRARTAGDWKDVLATLARIQRLHPLTAAQTELKATADQKLGTPKATPVAVAKVSGGGSAATAAKPVKRPAKAPASPGSHSAATTGGGAATPPAGASSTTAPAQPSVANPSAAPSGGVVTGQPTAAGAMDCSDGAMDPNMTMHAGHC